MHMQHMHLELCIVLSGNTSSCFLKQLSSELCLIYAMKCSAFTMYTSLWGKHNGLTIEVLICIVLKCLAFKTVDLHFYF